MKLIYLQKKIEEAMCDLENIDCLTVKNKKTFLENQKKINRAYKLLDKMREEIINERIKNKLAKQKQK